MDRSTVGMLFPNHPHYSPLADRTYVCRTIMLRSKVNWIQCIYTMSMYRRFVNKQPLIIRNKYKAIQWIWFGRFAAFKSHAFVPIHVYVGVVSHFARYDRSYNFWAKIKTISRGVLRDTNINFIRLNVLLLISYKSVVINLLPLFPAERRLINSMNEAICV